MKTILVDDEPWMIEQFRQECGELEDMEVEGTFSSSRDALAFAAENRVDFALLDVQMPGLNGLELSRELRKLYPEVVIVFVTAYPEYLRDMIDARSDYILLKPYSTQQVRDVLERVRYLSKRIRKRIFIRTFGTFDVFVDGVPMDFEGRRSKELLAYLVNLNGSVGEPRMIFTAIWEDKEYSKVTSSYYRKAMASLERTLDRYDARGLVRRSDSGASVNRDFADCDLFDFLDDTPGSAHTFGGEYMSQYSWGEETLARLMMISSRDN